MVDWFDTIEAVCVKGLPERIQEAHGRWELQLKRAHGLLDDLRTGKEEIAKAWTGQAGRVYSDHLESITKALEKADESLRPVLTLLDQSGRALLDAFDGMPIPFSMVDDVARAHREHLDNYESSTVWGNSMDWDKIRDMPSWQRFFQEVGGTVDDWVVNAFSDEPEHAQQKLNDLNGSNRVTHDMTDDAKPVDPGKDRRDERLKLTGGADPNAVGAMPKIGGYDPAALRAPDRSGGDVSDRSGVSDRFGVSGLSGADGDFGGGRPDIGGPGPGGGGPGRGGLGPALTPVSTIGRAVTPMTPMMPPMGAAGAGRGAGANAGSRAGRGGAMMGGRGAGGLHDEGDEYSSWLVEDDDVWGADPDVAPPVLGG